MELISRKMFTKSEEQGALLSNTFYTNNNNRLMNYITKIKRSDTFSDSIIQISDDNLKTYYKRYNDKTSWETSKGTMTKYFKVQIVDEKNDNFYMFYNQGLLPNNNPEEGIKNWQMYYSMSKDGGETFEFYEPIILEGDKFNETHPIEGVYRGKNSFMVGDYPCVPLILDDKKTILLAIQIAVLDENMELYNPYNATTYQSSHVLKGEILDNGKIRWYGISNRMLVDSTHSTRGILEPCICNIDNNRILMVNRASNARKFDIPSYRWYSISKDLGETFEGPLPWTYTSGEKFYSPSSCSQLLKHSNNKIYWIGNICKENARGNMPRNPLCIVEVDKKTLLLKKQTKFDVATINKEDYMDVTFSNFYAREEKETGNILIHCTSMWHNPKDPMESEGSELYTVKT